MPEMTYNDQVDHLAGVLADAALNGIKFGSATLARRVLDAGYRRVPAPPPAPRGTCRVCTAEHDLVGELQVVAIHDGPLGPGDACLGSRLTPLQVVTANA